VLDLLREPPGGGNTQGLAAAGISPAAAVQAAWKQYQEQKPLRKKSADNPEEKQALERLFTMASLYSDLPSFLDILAVSGPEGAGELRKEGVRVMTIHASKGLEFDHVFVAGLEEGILPFTMYEDKEQANESRIEEERRLLYVAMTRARVGLYLSWAESRNFRNRKCIFGPSRFLSSLEALVPLVQDRGKRQRESQMQLF
jgi:superfamily I DNA/RNA helicase